MPQPLVSDALLDRVAPLLPRSGRADRHVQHAGRKPCDPRKILNGIVFVLTTGVPWRALPATSDFPSGHTCRRQLRRWHRAGVWQALQREPLAELRRKSRLHLSRAVVDSVSQRAPTGGRKTGKNPVDRAKAGVKHHLLTDARGTPLAVILTGANRHDVTQLMPLLEKVPEIGGRPGSPRRWPRSLFGDRGYDSNRHRRGLRRMRIRPFIAKEGTLHGSGLGQHRWVVERTLAWLHQFKKLRIRQERTVPTYQALTDLACCLICLRTLVR